MGGGAENGEGVSVSFDAPAETGPLYFGQLKGPSLFLALPFLYTYRRRLPPHDNKSTSYSVSACLNR